MMLVNCEWDEWKIGKCDKTCGGGMQTNTRVKKSEAKYGGEKCEGLSKITQLCNVQDCPGKPLLCAKFCRKSFLNNI